MMKQNDIEAPSIRLAISGTGGHRQRTENVFAESGAPSVRLAVSGGEIGRPRQTDPVCERLPALLISYVYLEQFLKHFERYKFRDWALDSGAFSAWKSGTEIDLQEYIAECKRLMKQDKRLVEIFALDVIGDHAASIQNCETMWRAGVEAIPTFHVGEPEEALQHIADRYPKIAVGGLVGRKRPEKIAFLDQVFARVWPKRIHGFGVADEVLLNRYPFHSVDATSWEMGPCAFGKWTKFGKMCVRGSNQNLRSELEHYLKLEDWLRTRWAKEMALLERLEDQPKTGGRKNAGKKSGRGA